MKRHKDKVVIRKPNNIRRSRAAVSPADIRAVVYWFLKNCTGAVFRVPCKKYQYYTVYRIMTSGTSKE